jgi:hypothetical protein
LEKWNNCIVKQEKNTSKKQKINYINLRQGIFRCFW